MTFEKWMQKVDDEIGRICGLSYSDLPDYAYRDAYNDEAEPEEIARKVLAYDGFPF